MKCIVVLSGGQDSATCLAMAVKRYGADEVGAITFKYGQRHAVEVKYAKQLARRFGVKAHKIVGLDFYRELTSNALMDPHETIRTEPGAKCPNTVVEGRNAIFLMMAAVWAKSVGAKEIYIGVSEADFSGYPDCREAFVKSQQRTLRLALDYPVRIVAPFMHKSKAEEWALADKLGILDVILNHTVTCYNGIPGEGCGECPSCRLRRKGYEDYRRKLRRA